MEVQKQKTILEEAKKEREKLEDSLNKDESKEPKPQEIPKEDPVKKQSGKEEEKAGNDGCILIKQEDDLEQQIDNEKACKLLVIGDSQIGKSPLIKLFL